MTSERLERAMARLDALVNWERRERRGMRIGIEPARDVLARLGNPQLTLRAVHVTGTKGKGTTAALIAAGLVRAGVRTGLYTSPHIEHVNERVRVDGAEIDDETLATCLEDAFSARAAAVAENTPGDEATWFDLLTTAAFLHFSRARCTWAVVEVGIGGRLDSTNVIDGEVAVVTNVDLEHVQVLGDTRAAIALEKGGIVKRGATLVTGVRPDASRGPDDDAGRVLERIARELDVNVLRPEVRARTMFERDVDLARLALDELGRRGVRGRDREIISARRLDAEAIDGAHLPGRQELRWHGRTPVMLDGAHVASSMTALLDECARDPRLTGPPQVVLALGRDKDAPAILKALVGRADRLVCTTVASGPLRAWETLAEEASRAGFDAETAANPTDALAKALQHAEKNGGWVLVTGSFHLVGALRPMLRDERTEQDRDADHRL